MSSIDIKTEGSLLVLTVTGNVVTDHVVAIVNEYYSNGIVKDVIWDYTNGSLLSVSQTDFNRIIAAIINSLASGSRANGRTAYVGDRTVEFGILRMFTVSGETQGITIPYNVFRTIEEARRWLAQHH